MCTCPHVHVYDCTCVCACLRLYVSVNVLCVRTCVLVCVCVCVYLCLHVCACRYVHVCFPVVVCVSACGHMSVFVTSGETAVGLAPSQEGFLCVTLHNVVLGLWSARLPCILLGDAEQSGLEGWGVVRRTWLPPHIVSGACLHPLHPGLCAARKVFISAQEEAEASLQRRE